jgi:hypothetical protein
MHGDKSRIQGPATRSIKSSSTHYRPAARVQARTIWLLM